MTFATARAAARLLLLLSLSAAWPRAVEGQEVLRFEHLTVEDGLPGDTVNALAQDGFGFLWIGTRDGLARFDGYDLRRYVRDPDDPASLPHNDVRALAVDARGRLWVGTRGGGLARYEASSERFTRWESDRADPEALHTDNVSALAADGRGGLWVGSRTDGVAFLDTGTGRFARYPVDRDAPGAIRGSRVSTLRVARDGTVWVGGMGHGLYRFEPGPGRFRQYLPVEGDPSSLPDPRVLSLHEDAAGRLWVGTAAGLARWDPGSGSFRRGPADDAVAGIADAPGGHLWLSLPGTGVQRFDPERGGGPVFRHHPIRRHSLATASTSALLVDRAGVLWVGTDAGVDRHDPATWSFESYAADPASPHALPGDDLWGVDQTADGALWLATAETGVVRFDPQSRTWTQYRHDPADPSSLASDRIYCLLVDSADRVWVGTADAGLDLYDPRRDAWLHHRPRPGDPESIFHDSVYSLREGRDGRLWVGLNRGFDLHDPQSGRFTHPAVIEGDPDGGMLATTFDVVEGPGGLVWAATFLNGLFTLDPATREWVRYGPDEAIPDSLGSARINALLVDREGAVWAGTDVGLYRHLGEGNHWRVYGRKQGFVNENVAALHQGPEGAIWVGTTHGLHRLDPETGAVRVLLAEDGLPSSEIAWHALATLRDGRLAVGTKAGFALLDLAGLEARGEPPGVVLTGLELFNDPVPVVPPGAGAPEDGRLALERSILVADALTLGPRNSVFTLEFAALDYARPERIRYAYRLEGWDDGWLTTSARRRFATYTNLPPGEYAFRVRAAHGDGAWGEPAPPLAITVLPPLWKTWWAYTLYGVAFLGLLGGVVWSLHRRAEHQRRRAEREAAVSEQLRRVDRLKDEFLANTSHELRTPLHGMIGLAESLIDGATGALPEPAVRNLSMVVASGRRLGSLIDDLLDFSKLRHRSLALQRRPLDLRPLADVVLTLHRPLVGERDLVLVNAVPHDLPLADADEGRIEQVLHNLVGNAVKFTSGGRVTLSAEARGEELAVTVADTGPGIGPADVERIFVPFEQLAGGTERAQSGTGLGLAISRQLVELHGGRLTVSSVPGEGSAFTFTLPRSRGEAPSGVEAGRTPRRDPAPGLARVSGVAGDEAPALVEIHTPGPAAGGAGRFKVLVVDDEPVNRQVLVNQLSLHDYRIVQATGGEEALAAFERETPDLVLLDIMMPRMSGYDVCRRLREGHEPSELPVIYLSAKNQVRDLVTGFETGANDYLTKPITKAELIARVGTHLQLLDVHRNLERRVAERSEELRRANEQLRRLSAVDPLTGVPNRRSFDDALARAWADHRRRGAVLSVLLIDVDSFKDYNDRYGHQQGDEVLRAVARALQAALHRTTDLVARYGGEEFVVILPDTTADGAARVARLLLDAVGALRIPHEGSRVADHVTLSIGVAAAIPRPVVDASALVERADRALYAAKDGGRNRVEVDSDIREG